MKVTTASTLGTSMLLNTRFEQNYFHPPFQHFFESENPKPRSSEHIYLVQIIHSPMPYRIYKADGNPDTVDKDVGF